MLPSEDDNVQFNILLEAAQALQELEYLRTDATTLQEVFDAVQAKVDATAKKMGVSFMAMERNFKDVISLAEQARAELAQMSPMDAQALLASNPNAQLLSQTQSPFSAVSQATGWTEVNAIQKEILKNQSQELKLAEATAGAINQEALAEKKKYDERVRAVAMAQRELDLVEKEAEQALKFGGQMTRTAQQTMQLLNSFAASQQGQSILTKFFGDYKSAQGITAQLGTIKTAVKSLSEATGASFSQAGQIIKQQFGNIPGIANQVNQATNQMGKSFEEAGIRSVRSIDAIRIALGALISMIIFQAIQAITQFFSEASKQARQLEDTLYRLGNVERSLSMEGITISLKGLEDGITRIQRKMPIFSREDVSQLVGTLAISTKQLHLTEAQILDLAQAVAVLNVRSEKQEDLSVTAQHVLSSLLTGNAKGITGLGLAFTENVMKAKAMELGFLEAGDALSKLSENEKGQTKLAIVLESTGQELQSVNEYLDTNTAKVLQNKAAWQDFLAFIGQQINNLIPNVVPALEKLQKAFELKGLQKLFAENLGLVERFGIQNSVIFGKLSSGAALTAKEYEHLREVLSRMSDEQILEIFPDPSAIKDRFTRELIQSLVDVKDTATDTQAALDFEAESDTEALDDLDAKIEEIAIDAKQAKEDLDILLSQKQADLEIKFAQKTEDIDTEYFRKGEDAARDYANKIVDINRDSDQKIADAKRDARDKEKREEQELALKLKQLREKFLMDLEDALHARDARQVLRLIREYKFDKQAILDKAALDKKQRKDDLESKLKDIEIERQRKLESARIEYEQKLVDLAIAKQRELDELNTWKQREEEDLALWYQRELEEIDRNTQHKLERLLAGYIEEEKIHEESQARIHEILAKWFGENTALVDNLMAYTNSAFATMAANAAMALGAMSAISMMGSFGGGGIPNSSTSPVNPMGTHRTSGNTTTPSSGGASPTRYAEGGTLLATKPTTVTFGESGAEMAQFTPISRVGRDVGKVFGDISGAKNSMDGKLALDITLSPDLEARIVDRSLNESANIVAKITRTKS